MTTSVPEASPEESLPRITSLAPATDLPPSAKPSNEGSIMFLLAGIPV